MNNRFYGTGVALVTPFDKLGNIDYTGLKQLLLSTARKGADYYVVQGTTGESATTSATEKRDLLEFVKINNEDQLPIVYGIGGNHTAEVLKNIENSALDDTDALLSVSPYYNKPSQEGIYQHFIKIADKSPIPIILYNVPGRTASNITADTTLRLAEHANIIGIKEASGDLVQAMHIAKHMPEGFQLISGDDLLTLPLMSIGATGIISVLGNAFAHLFKTITDSAKIGDHDSARKATFELLAINPLMYAESNPVGVKYVLKLQGICEEHVRLPLMPASPQLRGKIAEALDRMSVHEGR